MTAQPGPKVEGCGTDLRSSTSYYQARSICGPHASARSVVQDGRPMRFCHHCVRFQPLDEFDSDKWRALFHHQCSLVGKPFDLLC